MPNSDTVDNLVIDLVLHCTSTAACVWPTSDFRSSSLKRRISSYLNPEHSKLIVFIQPERGGMLLQSVVEIALLTTRINLITEARSGIKMLKNYTPIQYLEFKHNLILP
uniref:Uncharacterized protein n=1 Tax=Chrysemys picta bellii TaxID=8478 RepID=A0A8C3IRE1_CHRPI